MGRYIARGHLRWERAALNAVRRPNTKAAKLYRARVATASLLAGATVETRAYAFLAWHQHGEVYVDPVTGAREYIRLPATLDRDSAVCSEYCLFMQLQLESRTTDPYRLGERLAQRVDDATVAVLDPRMLARSIRCQGCGCEIKRAKR